ncbi:MAG TPA: hypothetical protein VMD30_04560 [Tepidisphaeraceae bacterium]|nr:hypothetical protein [Tepidisphaeraceae bacterium]
MTIERLKELHERKPFQPFTVHLADGEKVRVAGPEFMWRPPNSRTFYVSTGGNGEGTIHYIDLLLVPELTTGPTNVKRKHNGKH